MTLGSAYSTVKGAVFTRLAGRPRLQGVALDLHPPADALKVTGPHGSGEAIWFADAEGDYTNEIICGPGRLDLDETFTLTIVLQALPKNTSDTQIVTDRRVDELLGEVLTAMAEDPTWGVTDFPVCQSTYGSVRRFGGPMGDRPMYPSRAEFDLVVEARLTFS